MNPVDNPLRNADILCKGPHQNHSVFQYANLKKFYQDKIDFLLSEKGSDALIKLVCADVPFHSGSLRSWWERKRFINGCIKYYKSKIREIDRQERGNWLMDLFF